MTRIVMLNASGRPVRNPKAETLKNTFIEKFEYKVEKISTMSENFTIFAV